MKMFAVLLALASFPTFGAIIDGCYKTVSLNGESVMQGPEEESNLTKIYSRQSSYYFDTSYQNLTTKIISVFTGFNGGWYSYSNPLVFEELGETFESESEWGYEFAGEVYFTDQPYIYKKSDFKTSVHFEWSQDGLLHGQIQQVSEVLARNYQLDLVLEKAVCPID